MATKKAKSTRGKKLTAGTKIEEVKPLSAISTGKHFKDAKITVVRAGSSGTL